MAGVTVEPPPVPYASTSVRPAWSELPEAVRSGIEARLGCRVVAAASAGGGFTGGFASVLRDTTGAAWFVKATPLGSPVHPSYLRESVLNPLLPAGLPAPRVRWAGEVEDWFVLAGDAVDGRVPRLPWARPELDAVLAALAESGRLLATLPAGLRYVAPGLGRLASGEPAALDSGEPAALDSGEPAALDSGELAVADLVEDHAADFDVWRRVSTGATHLPGLAPEAAVRVDELAEVEAGWVGAAGEGLAHADLRPDNTLVDAAGRGWVCDWNWAVRGAPWFDLVGLLPTVHASGLDASAVLAAHPVGRSAPAAAVDGVLAALSGFFAEASRQAPFPGASPWLTEHRRWYGAATFGWLAERRGWELGRPRSW